MTKAPYVAPCPNFFSKDPGWNSRRSVVVGDAPASHMFVAGMYAHGNFYGVSSSCKEFESEVKYITASVRSRIRARFAAVGILDGCSLEARRDYDNPHNIAQKILPDTLIASAQPMNAEHTSSETRAAEDWW